MMMNTSVIRFHSKKSDVLDDRYLYSWLRSAEFKDQAEMFAHGAAQRNFGPVHINKMSICLPPIAVQRRIAGILTAYDELIENNTRRISILEEMARRLFDEWFVRFRFPGHETIKLVDSPLGPVPSSWSLAPLETLCDRITDGSHWSLRWTPSVGQETGRAKRDSHRLQIPLPV
jgi:type I restriction enzyme S subunit